MPKSVKEARSYLGLTNLSETNNLFSNYAVKISDLTKKKSFETLKKKCISGLIIAFPDIKSEEHLIVTVGYTDLELTGVCFTLKIT